MLKRAKKIGICLCAMIAIVAAYSGLNIAGADDDNYSSNDPSCNLVKNAGGRINTWYSEGELSFANDGTVVFCTNRQDLALVPGDPKDLYLAKFDKKTGMFSMPVNMGIPVNAAPATNIDPLRKGDDREPWITPDGNTIYFKSDRLATTVPLNVNDIFVTHKVNGVWQTPELVGNPVSTDAGNEHCPMLMKDGKLCYTSSRAGGYGGSDIWCSAPDGIGGWLYPENQGPNINTAATEYHFTDNQNGTRVFVSSARPGGQGGMDIWASNKLIDGSWGPAVNIGAQFNTVGNDACTAFTPDYKKLFWFSSRLDNSYGNVDIYWTAYSNVQAVIGP